MQLDDTSHFDASWFSKERRTAQQVLSPRFLRLRGLASSAGRGPAVRKLRTLPDQSIFSPSENDLIELAREDILFRRRCDEFEKRRERVIFLVIVMLTALFPLIGLLALWHKFDSTISWYTHGELHDLTRSQRTMLKWQLLVEVILYPVMITALAVHYSLPN